MNLSRLFILRPVATTLAMVALALAGLLAYRELPVSALPQVDFPTIQVTTLYPGAGPDVMTALVTSPLERQFGQMPGLSQMLSTSSGGSSRITLRFDLGLPLQSDPDLISRDGKVAWQTGLWFWMTQSGAGYRSGHASMVGGNGFGETIRSLNGSLECNGGNPGQVQSRVDAYRRFCRLLGVDPGANLGC